MIPNRNISAEKNEGTMNGQFEPEPQIEVVFVVEATSMNGTYVNELKTSYIHPILE